MMNNSGYRIILKEAFKAFRKKSFSEATVLLEKIISHPTKEPYPYFLLCVSYLLCNKFSDADMMIKKIRAADPDYLPLKQLELFLLLKSASNIHDVLASCIEKLDQYPKDKYFTRSLLNLRKIKDFSAFQKKARLTDFVNIPKPKSGNLPDNYQSTYGKPEKPTKTKNYAGVHKTGFLKILIIILVIFLLITLSGTIYYYLYLYPISTNQETKNSLLIDNINIDILQYELIDKILKSKPPVFYYSNDEVINDFNKAKILIKNEKYNDALIIINKIANSNANYRVKERNEFLQKYISNVEYKNYSPIPVEKVLQKPYLYKGSFVKWKGKIANLKSNENKLQFNLLIDYAKEDKFSGVIDVFYGKEYKDIKNGDIVILEGIFINTIGNNNRIYLAADRIIK